MEGDHLVLLGQHLVLVWASSPVAVHHRLDTEDDMDSSESRREWPEYMSPETAAKYLDVSINTLSDWRTKGTGPAFKRLGPRLVRYRRQDLDEWAAP